MAQRPAAAELQGREPDLGGGVKETRVSIFLVVAYAIIGFLLGAMWITFLVGPK